MGITSIEWTDRSINPFRARDNDGHTGHYCEKISQGCANCYASTMQKRFKMPEYKFNTGVDGNIFLDESKLQEVLRRKTPTKWFWCDMTDIFLDLYPDEWIDKCFAVMALTPQHTHQILTKRPERMREYMKKYASLKLNEFLESDLAGRMRQVSKGLGRPIWVNAPISYGKFPFKNIWLGCSVEDQKTADERIPILLDTPAAVRWISAEPLLGEIKLDSIHPDDMLWINSLRGYTSDFRSTDSNNIPTNKLDWVVIGGESGSKARPMDVRWAEKIVEDCMYAGVPPFMKQLGAKPYCSPYKDGSTGFELMITDRKGKEISEFPDHLQVREYPPKFSANKP